MRPLGNKLIYENPIFLSVNSRKKLGFGQPIYECDISQIAIFNLHPVPFFSEFKKNGVNSNNITYKCNISEYVLSTIYPDLPFFVLTANSGKRG